MSLPCRALVLLATAACALAAAAPANAAWRGSPGKIAFIDRGAEMPLKVFTPKLGQGSAITVRAETFHFPLDAANDTTPITNGFPSAPAWSPDGTRLAFAAKVPDTGIGNGATHTAIFVWTLASGETTQITTPPAGRLDPNPDDNLQQGYAYADYAPAWSPDGTKLAFVRIIAAGKDESVYAERGANVRTVSLAAGGSSQLTHMYGEQIFSGLSWGGDPAGKTKLVGYHASEANGIRLLAIDPASGSTSTVMSGVEAAMVIDFDVTPDGLGARPRRRRVGRGRQGPLGQRPHRDRPRPDRLPDARPLAVGRPAAATADHQHPRLRRRRHPVRRQRAVAAGRPR